jgi:CDP-glucose 4,6-dehydratase
MINARFWKNKKVFITGHEGFLGSNLASRLVACGARVTGLDIDVRRKNTFFTDADYCKIRTVKGSVADHALVMKMISEVKPEVIFHLAAEAIVGKCNNDPIRAFKANIEGTWNILEASRGKKYVKAIVVASSDKAYGCHKILPYTEKAPLIGSHPYDVSKSCADLIAYAYHNTYKVQVAVTRCGNIYGPGDFNFSRILPDAMRCSVNGDTLMIRSDGKYTRDYVYVDDIVNGYVLLAENLQKKRLSGEAFNFSDENPVTVLQLLKKLRMISGNKLSYKILNQAQYEIKHQYLDSQKARRVLGWRPLNSLNAGLEKTIEWYNRYLAK